MELWVIAVVAVVFALLRLGHVIPPPFVGTAEAAACPIVDGGAGDDDASANGVITVSGSKTFTAITGTYDCTATPFLITSTGTLVLAGNPTTGQIAAVNFGTLTVDSGGKISADAQGCVALLTYYGAGPNGSNVCISNNSGSLNTYSGGAVNTAGAGGGHAGPGGTASAGSGVAGATYDSATAPTLFGSTGGGANGSLGGASGGGVVKIGVTGTLTLNGTISANGNSGVPDTSGRATGGGSGGSIYITANTLSGATGLIQAKGGNGGANVAFGGGGGGGRVAVYVAGGTYTFNATNLDVAGGSAGGGSAVAGTKGTVYVKNTTTNAVTIYHGFTFDNSSHFVSSWTEDASAANQYCDAAAVTPAIHATGAIAFAGTLNCATSITSFTIDSSTTLALANSSSLTVNGGLVLSAGSNFSMGTGVTIAGTRTNTDIEFNIPSGNSQTWDSLSLTTAAEGEFITDDAFALTLQNGTAINGNVRWTALTSLTQNFGTSINASGRGCAGTANYSSVPNGSNVCATDSSVAVYGPGAGGAGHGGGGGAGSTSTGRGTYDSATTPVLFGASGGGGNSSPTGANGGGLVRIVVTGTVTLNGDISTDGANGTISGANAGGGGAGGAINITAGALNGTTGTFSAKGGNGADSTNDGGGGGGGRISISHAGGSFAFDASDFTVTGGTVTGSATAGTKGTVYVKDTATNAVNVYHGFSFDNTNHFVSSWTVDASATNQYCEPSAVTPSIHSSGAITLASTLNCSSALTSFTADAATTLTVANSASVTINGGILFTAGASLSMGTGVTITNTRTNY
ncbi:MAG TPA: hypothetical protein VLC10_04100, partial [Patescibacteria group bacterium]|nr:hypothetical protein [Patescibacteria group bacterium]